MGLILLIVLIVLVFGVCPGGDITRTVMVPRASSGRY